MRHLLMAGFLSLLTTGLRGQTPEEGFWTWFRSHENQLLALQRADEPIANQLMQFLARVHPDLTFEFGPSDARPREFIVSAGGIRTAFPAVEHVVAAAPALPRWRVIAFRPARTGPVNLTVAGLSVSSGDVRVLAERDGDRVGLTVALPGFRGTPDRAFEQAGYLLLDHYLGEFAVETRIGFIRFVDAAAAGATGWRPIEKAPTAVAAAARD